jgi:hypothetical protein
MADACVICVMYRIPGSEHARALTNDLHCCCDAERQVYGSSEDGRRAKGNDLGMLDDEGSDFFGDVDGAVCDLGSAVDKATETHVATGAQPERVDVVGWGDCPIVCVTGRDNGHHSAAMRSP